MHLKVLDFNFMEKFEKLNNENIAGDFFRCVNCKEVMEQAQTESHQCPIPQKEAERKEILEIIANESLPTDERIKMVMLLAEEEKKAEEAGIKKIEHDVNPNTLRKLVYSVILENIQSVRHYRDSEYIKNDQRRNEGIPFEERMRMINKRKIDWCDIREKKLLHDSKTFRVKPIREWLSMADIEWAKSRGEGMKFIINFNLERVYSVPKYNQIYG
jgi:hypothetical protein